MQISACAGRPRCFLKIFGAAVDQRFTTRAARHAILSSAASGDKPPDQRRSACIHADVLRSSNPRMRPGENRLKALFDQSARFGMLRASRTDRAQRLTLPTMVPACG